MGRLAEPLVALMLFGLCFSGVSAQRADAALPAWLVENGFANRYAEGAGLLHMTRRDLSLQGGRDLAEVLRAVPGLRLRRLVDGGTELVIEGDTPGSVGDCRVDMYLNGAFVELGRFHWTGADRADRAMRPLRLEDLLRLEQVDGLELYGPETSPVATEAGCGALLIWSGELRASLNEPLVGTITGAVTDEAGRPVADARIVLGSDERVAVTDESGEFTFEDVAPGRYTLAVEVEDVPGWSAQVVAKAFATVMVEVRIGGGGVR